MTDPVKRHLSSAEAGHDTPELLLTVEAVPPFTHRQYGGDGSAQGGGDGFHNKSTSNADSQDPQKDEGEFGVTANGHASRFVLGYSATVYPANDDRCDWDVDGVP